MARAVRTENPKDTDEDIKASVSDYIASKKNFTNKKHQSGRQLKSRKLKLSNEKLTTSETLGRKDQQKQT